MKLPTKSGRLSLRRLPSSPLQLKTSGVRHALGRLIGLTVLLVAVAALLVIGSVAAGPTMARAVQPSGAAKRAIGDGGPLKRIGVPVAGKGYGDVTFSGDSRRFIAVNYRGENKNVRVWDVSTLQPLCDPLPEKTGAGWGLTYDGKIAFTTDRQSIRFWDVGTSKLIRATKITDGELKDVAISRDGTQFLAIVKDEQAVEVWRTGEARPRLLIKQDPVDAAFDPTGKRIAILDASYHIFSAETGREAYPPITSSSDALPELAEAFDSTGRRFLVLDRDAFKVVDTETGRTLVQVLMGKDAASSEETGFVRWSSDQSKIVATPDYPQQSARIYNAENGKLERTIGTKVRNCWIGPGSRWVIGSRDTMDEHRLLHEALDVWDMNSGRCVQTLNLQNRYLSPDCSTIVTEAEDGLGEVWHMQQ